MKRDKKEMIYIRISNWSTIIKCKLSFNPIFGNKIKYTFLIIFLRVIFFQSGIWDEILNINFYSGFLELIFFSFRSWGLKIIFNKDFWGYKIKILSSNGNSIIIFYFIICNSEHNPIFFLPIAALHSHSLCPNLTY